MFEKGKIFQMDGTYTKYVMDTLVKKPVMLIVKGKPAYFGGPKSINRDMMNELLARPTFFKKHLN